MTLLGPLRLVVAAALCAALTACVPSTDSVADDVSRSANKVILVGSFEITPKIPQSLNVRQSVARPLEEALFGSADDFAADRLITGFLPLGTARRPNVYSTPWVNATHSVPLDELFFIEVDRTAIQMQNGQFLLSDMGVDSISLPGGFVTATHPSAQVVYVGTIRYSRDDFFAVTNVRILDRYSQAVDAARQLYGPDVTVAKSLWRTGQ